MTDMDDRRCRIDTEFDTKFFTTLKALDEILFIDYTRHAFGEEILELFFHKGIIGNITLESSYFLGEFLGFSEFPRSFQKY